MPERRDLSCEALESWLHFRDKIFAQRLKFRRSIWGLIVLPSPRLLTLCGNLSLIVEPLLLLSPCI